MKKLLILALAATFLLSLAATASAAISVRGELRLWWESVQNDYLQYNSSSGRYSSQSTDKNSLIFDRLAVRVKADYSQESGIDSMFSLRTLRSNTDNASDAYIRTDIAYYYQKNLLTKGDIFRAGILDAEFPFHNGYYNHQTLRGFSDSLRIGQAVGMAYYIEKPVWGFGMGIANAKTGYKQNDWNMDEDYTWSSRVNYMPLKGLKAGVGYAHEKASNNLVVDVSYENPTVPLSGRIEYASATPTDASLTGSTDPLTGIFAEAGYDIRKNTRVYAGRAEATSTSNNRNIFVVHKPALAVGACNAGNNYSFIGLERKLSNNIQLNVEYSVVDEGFENITANEIKKRQSLAAQCLFRF